MILTLSEIISMIVMTIAVGYIFKDSFTIPETTYDPIRAHSKNKWKHFKTAIIITAPAIILHEFGHKFVALAFGFPASFEISLGWLSIGVILKILSSPFLFFVPAFVTMSSQIPLGLSALIAFAGPAVNLLIWFIAKMILEHKKLTHQQAMMWIFTRKLNGFLFLFNMIPLPPFDGSHVFSALATLLF